MECSDHEKEDIRKFCLTQRNSIECQGEFKMVIGTAWTLKSICQIAKSYGEVIYLDVTEGTTDEETIIDCLYLYGYVQSCNNTTCRVAE